MLKSSISLLAAAMLWATTTAHAEIGNIPAELIGHWCMVPGSIVDTYRAGQCGPEDNGAQWIHFTLAGYTHSDGHCVLVDIELHQGPSFLATFHCRTGPITRTWSKVEVVRQLIRYVGGRLEVTSTKFIHGP